MKAKDAVAYRIDALCRQKTITYNELAIRSGITASTVYSIFDVSRRNIGITTIMKICDGLDVTLKQFFDDSIFENVEQEIE